jgi:acyl carrier protein phosphodiesterase
VVFCLLAGKGLPVYPTDLVTELDKAMCDKTRCDYANDFYQLLQDNYDILTERIKRIMPYMIARNWLVSYATIEGIEMILFQMDYKTKHRANMQEAVVELQDFYSEFESEFFLFFDVLMVSCKQKIIDFK